MKYLIKIIYKVKTHPCQHLRWCPRWQPTFSNQWRPFWFKNGIGSKFWRVICEFWIVTYDLWVMTCYLWLVTCDSQVTSHSPQVTSHSSQVITHKSHVTLTRNAIFKSKGSSLFGKYWSPSLTPIWLFDKVLFEPWKWVQMLFISHKS